MPKHKQALRGRICGLSKAARTRRTAIAIFSAFVVLRLSIHLLAQNQAPDLARLAAGIQAYERQDYVSAIASLQGLAPKIPKLADYAAYYLVAAEIENKSAGDIAAELAPVWSGSVASPLVAKAAITAASGLIVAGKPADAVRILTQHYNRLPQPEGDMALAFAHESAADLANASTYYQRVYYRYPASDAAANAAVALDSLRQRMADAYPAATPQTAFQRARRLMDAKQYARTHAELEALLPVLTGPEQDAARLGIGTADYLRGQVSAACQYLRDLKVSDPEVEAERLYYVAECAGRSNDESARIEAVQLLARDHPRSNWRFLATMSLANRYLLANRMEDYEPLYEAAARNFPAQPRAALAHWKYTWASYIRRKADAGDRLREHLRLFPAQAYAPNALYFLGRLAEDASDPAAARSFYTKLAGHFPNYYYGLLARQRLADSKIAPVTPSPQTDEWLKGIRLAPRRYTGPIAPSSETSLRFERASLLRSVGLGDLADDELRFGARNAVGSGGQPILLAIEMARYAKFSHDGLRVMKAFVPDSLAMPLEQAPQDFWQYLFPLPYKDDLVKYAQAQSLDPYLVAALVRQESEFDPRALSRAKAYGLTQVVPVTGRSLARKIGMRNFTSSMLYHPATNLRLGTMYLRELLEELGGNWEETLASYNGGKTRVINWRTWAEWREPAEFVESIPFSETREYVQSVLRNAELYRKIYGGR